MTCGVSALFLFQQSKLGTVRPSRIRILERFRSQLTHARSLPFPEQKASNWE